MIKWRISLLLLLGLLLLAPQCGVSPGPYPPTPAPLEGPALRVALLSPSTGELATFGRTLRNGSILAFDEWNSRGGVLGQRIKWVVYDADCAFEAARQATQQAITAGYQFIIGPLCSEAAIAAAEVAEANTALLIAPTATHPLVTVNGQGQTRPTVFRVSYAYPFQGQATARFAFDTLQVRRAALLIDPGDDYSATLGQAFAVQFISQGGEIVYRATYSPAETDFTPSLQAVGATGAEVLYLPAAVPVVNQMAGQVNLLKQSGSFTLTLLGSDSWSSPELDLSATAGSYFTAHFFLDDQRSQTQPWADTYQASYAVAPDTLAALGYDAATILMTAIQQAGTLDIKTIAKTLEQGDFEAVTGPISFDSQHNPLKPVPVVRVQARQIIFVGYVGGGAE